MRLPIIAALIFLVFPDPAFAAPFEGPLQVRNQFPLFISLDTPYLESAAVRDSATVSLSHSSVYVIESSADWTVNMDLELTELMVRLKKALNARTEMGLDIPFYRATQGFLDRPLESFHDALGTGDYGRNERPYNEFLYKLQYQGRPVIKTAVHESGIGDVRLTAKRVLREGGPLVSVQADIEAPTGDAKQGYGNGSFDWGLAVLVDLDLGKEYRGYCNAGAVFPGKLRGYETITMRAYAYAGFGVEAAWWERFSVIVQAIVASSPYPETGIRQVDWPGALLAFGGRYTFRSGSLDFSLTEDPDMAGAPDFILNLSVKRSF